MSGRLDSNQRPPAPKAGALTGLRYTPLFPSLHHKVCRTGPGELRFRARGAAEVGQSCLKAQPEIIMIVSYIV